MKAGYLCMYSLHGQMKGPTSPHDLLPVQKNIMGWDVKK
jgi:hypothetical protein